ncbi:MAG: hypothetical protein J5875_05245 [Paludibacteraceae bacterium]|nr:hypothetical protein [Paludibacteraceae bacterium]
MKKLYYKIKNSNDGGFPQVDCDCVPIMQLISPWSLYNEKFCSLEFTLNKKAVLTDLLSKIAGFNTDLLISEKLKNMISDCDIMQHQYFDAIVNTKKGPQTYFLLHLCQPNLVNYIDYKNTIFYETEWGFYKCPISIDSYEHYLNLKSKDKKTSFGVEIEKLAMTENFDRSIDMFYILPFDSSIYISERMKKIIEENKITGIKFVDEITI